MCNQRWTQKPKIPANMRLLFQWEEDSKSTPGMISVMGSGDRPEGGTERVASLPVTGTYKERPGYPPRSPNLTASLTLRDSSIPGVATATPYTNPSYRVLAGHTLPPESGEQFKGTRPGTHPSVPSTGGLSPARVTSLYLFTLLLPSSCTPASLRRSHASPHRKRAALSPALEGLWSFHWGTVVDAHIPGSSPVRLRPPR